MKHTPGPWTINRHGKDPSVSEIRSSKLAGVGQIATVFANADANARLIAAAPDLLAALQETAFLISDCDVLDSAKDLEVLEQARAAIAKATQE